MGVLLLFSSAAVRPAYSTGTHVRMGWVAAYLVGSGVQPELFCIVNCYSAACPGPRMSNVYMKKHMEQKPSISTTSTII